MHTTGNIYQGGHQTCTFHGITAMSKPEEKC